MCGIAGILTFGRLVPDRALLGRMADTLLHRGPDAEGIHTAEHIGLAQRRLSIIDLADSANPPLANEDQTVWVIFNGEIYNFLELRAELMERGHVFATHSDTEVLVHLYEEYGPDMVQRLNGMFAFAIWDARRKRLFAARDRLGKKPLVYARTGNLFAFGSAIKAITVIPEIPCEPDFAAIDAYLTRHCVPSPQTAFKGISKLPAAHALLCGADGSLKVYRYWSPPPDEVARFEGSREELPARLLSLIEDAVRCRLVADVPVGALLSGGVDSGLVVALMAQLSGKPVKTFTIGFDETEYSELAEARLVAERYGTNHHEIVLKPDVLEILPDLVRHYNEPFADSSAVPTYYVCKAAAEEVTVALSGDGGDESFSGYDRYGEMQLWERFDRLPRALRRSTGALLRSVAGAAPGNRVAARVDRGLMMVAGDLPERYGLMMSMVKPQEKRAWYGPVLRSAVHDFEPVNDLDWHSGMDRLNWMSRHDQQNYLPDCLMVKMDVAAMASSLEVRSPLLDYRLVEFAATVPGNLKRSGAEGKLLLREAARGLLPERILHRRKTGFGLPVSLWLRRDLPHLLDAYLLDDTARRRGLFDPAAIARIVSQHKEGRRDWSNRLWALLMLEMWFREFID